MVQGFLRVLPFSSVSITSSVLSTHLLTYQWHCIQWKITVKSVCASSYLRLLRKIVGFCLSCYGEKLMQSYISVYRHLYFIHVWHGSFFIILLSWWSQDLHRKDEKIQKVIWILAAEVHGRTATWVDDICTLLEYYAAYSGNSLPTLQDNLSVPSSKVKKSNIGISTLECGTDRLSCNFG